MKTLSYTHARSHLAKTMQEVIDDRDAVIITRQNADSVVMISLAEHNALIETDYLLRSPENARRLLASIEQDRAGEWRQAEVPGDSPA